MLHLFGSRARPIIYLSVIGLGMACMTAILPTGLILISVLTELLQRTNPGWFPAVVLDLRNLQALTNALIVALAVAVSLSVIGSVLALTLYRIGLTGDTWIYALALIPVLMPDYLVGVAGRALLEPQFGILAGLIPEQIFSERFSALAILATVVFFKWLPLVTVIIDARLATIQPAILRQAKLDFGEGVHAMQVTVLPEISRIIPLVFAFGFLIGFRQHELAIELTASGGGFSAELWSNWNYRTIYEFFDFSSGAAQALLALILLLVPMEILRRTAARRLAGD